MSSAKITPATNWPIDRYIILRDAWLMNPITVVVKKHANADHIVAEDAAGIVYYARTDRIEGFTSGTRDIDEDFADVLG